MQPTLVAGTVIAVLSAVVFLMVGRAVMRRPVSPELAFARNAFAAWWFALGANAFIGALQVVLVALTPSDLDLYTTLSFASLLLICVALWGLLYYLLFLFTNSSRILRPLSIGYGAYFILLVYYVLRTHVTGVVAGRWRLEPTYGNDLTGTPLFYTVVLLLLLPQFLCAFAYLTFYWRVEDRIQKRRILLVSLSIIAWFGTALVGTALGTETAASDAYEVFSRLVGLAAAGTIYYSFTGLGPAAGKENHAR